MFEELMNQLNEDLSYRPLTSSLSDADMVEIETDLGDEEHADPADETVQHLYLARDGKITFRSFTRGKGRGARGVGRYETCTVPAQTVQEIFDEFGELHMAERDWQLPDGARVIAIEHDDDTFLPSSRSLLHDGDVALVCVARENYAALSRFIRS